MTIEQMKENIICARGFEDPLTILFFELCEDTFNTFFALRCAYNAIMARP